MLRTVLAVLALFVGLPATFVQSAEPITVNWSDLPDPEAQVFEDPYRELSRVQGTQLAELISLRQQLATTSSQHQSRPELQRQLAELQNALETAGIDVDWLLSQRGPVAERRQRAALSVNENVVDKAIAIDGYLFPGKLDSNRRYVAFLLPSRNLCMHLPAPVPNQLIAIRMKQWPSGVGQRCVRARANGELAQEESRMMLSSADGRLEIWSMWHLDLSSISFPDYEEVLN